jgi:hypothetical protein
MISATDPKPVIRRDRPAGRGAGCAEVAVLVGAGRGAGARGPAALGAPEDGRFAGDRCGTLGRDGLICCEVIGRRVNPQAGGSSRNAAPGTR